MGPAEEEARRVLAHYEIRVDNVIPLKEKGKKATWSIDSDQGALILKRLPGTPARGEFIGAALWHLWQAGAGVPRPFRSKEGWPVVRQDENAYLLTEELRGRSPAYARSGELGAIMAGLARFHRASAGFEPPAGAEVPSLLGRWEEAYTRHLERLAAYREQARHEPGGPFGKLVRQVAGGVMAEMRACLEELEGPAYRDWVTACRRKPILCHQDYAAGNLVLDADGQVRVFDYDSLAFDLPARDLRKIFNKVMKERPAGWSAPLGRTMLEAYLAVHPLDREQLQVVLLDLRFPHLLAGIIDKYYRRREDWSPGEFVKKFERLIFIEKSKGSALEELRRWVSGR